MEIVILDPFTKKRSYEILIYNHPVCFSFLLPGADQRSSSSYGLYENGQSIDAESTHTSNGFYFAPKVGYFFTNRWCAGLSLPISLSKNKTTISVVDYMDHTNTLREFSAGPFVRYYFPLKTKLFVITEVSYGWGRTRTFSRGPQYDANGDITTTENVSKSKSQQFRAGAGLSYLLNKNVGLELLATYRKPIDEDYYEDYSNIMVQLGLQIYLSK